MRLLLKVVWCWNLTPPPLPPYAFLIVEKSTECASRVVALKLWAFWWFFHQQLGTDKNYTQRNPILCQHPFQLHMISVLMWWAKNQNFAEVHFFWAMKHAPATCLMNWRKGIPKVIPRVKFFSWPKLFIYYHLLGSSLTSPSIGNGSFWKSLWLVIAAYLSIWPVAERSKDGDTPPWFPWPARPSERSVIGGRPGVKSRLPKGQEC